MRFLLRAHPTAWILIALQLISLVVLATLQFRWVGEVSRAERQRLFSGLELGAERLAADFDRELTRAFLHFQTAVLGAGNHRELGGPFVASTLDAWRERALYPSLLGEVYRIRSGGDDLEIQRLDEAAGRFVAVAWPAELDSLTARLRHFRSALEAVPPGPQIERGSLLLAPRVPALLVPLIRLSPPRVETWPRRRGRGARPRFELDGVLVLRLADERLGQEILPRLEERHLGDGQLIDHRWAVVATGGAPRLLYRSPGWAVEDAEQTLGGGIEGDVAVEMFGFVEREDLRAIVVEAGRAAAAVSADESGVGHRLWSQRLLPPLMTLMRGEGGGWRLVVSHPEGSLEEAVARLRRRNLGVGLGILLILVLSMVMLYATSRRAQRLAAQQVEFVAGISHELRTPLAAIGSLGQNLADGIANEPAQARRYGEVIRRETVRLTRMVDQVLELSGALTRKRGTKRDPVELAEVIAAVVADLRPLAAEVGGAITVAVGARPLAVRGDAEALRRAFENLIHNGIKYGGEGGLVEVGAEVRKGVVEVLVTDRGHGIAREDLSHIFEPFYRGRNATEAQIEGGGLGLSLVRRTIEAHDGRITVESTAGKGTTFTVTLPAVVTSATPVPTASAQPRSREEYGP